MPSHYREYDEREYLSPTRPHSEAGYYEVRDGRRQEYQRSSSRAGDSGRGREFASASEVDVRVRERSRDRVHPSARIAREELQRVQTGTGPLVLRQRAVETVERRRSRPRSPSPVRYQEVVRAGERDVDRIEIRERERERSRDRDHDRDRARSRSRVRYYREASRGPTGEQRTVTHIVERERSPSPPPSLSPSPSPPPVERDRIRIIEHSRSRAPSRAPSPPPAPEPRQVIRGPIVERDVITHYTDVDHGVVYANPPAPPPPPPQPARAVDNEIFIRTDRNNLAIDIDHRHRRDDRDDYDYDDNNRRPRRAHSAAPHMPPALRVSTPGYHHHSSYSDVSVDEEADYIASRIDQRGRMGEAYHGATQDWTIVDVPPGTERVRMDGVGGGSAEVTWQRYNGVRRTKFIPERREERREDMVAIDRRQSVTGRDRNRNRDRERSSSVSVQIVDSDHGREREIDVVTDRREDMWTEITKDLVSREAIERYGYSYTETKYSFYILQYLHSDEIQDLVDLTQRLQQRRNKSRHRHRNSVDEVDIEISRSRSHGRQHSPSHHRRYREDERVYEQEVTFDRLQPRVYN